MANTIEKEIRDKYNLVQVSFPSCKTFPNGVTGFYERYPAPRFPSKTPRWCACYYCHDFGYWGPNVPEGKESVRPRNVQIFDICKDLV